MKKKIVVILNHYQIDDDEERKEKEEFKKYDKESNFIFDFYSSSCPTEENVIKSDIIFCWYKNFIENPAEFKKLSKLNTKTWFVLMCGTSYGNKKVIALGAKHTLYHCDVFDIDNIYHSVLNKYLQYSEKERETEAGFSSEENIKAKQGEIMLFKDLPLNKKFYFPEDAEATKLNGGLYLQYYVKDEETKAHPCFTTEGCKSCRPLSIKFDVNPEAPIIFLNINAL